MINTLEDVLLYICLSAGDWKKIIANVNWESTFDSHHIHMMSSLLAISVRCNAKRCVNRARVCECVRACVHSIFPRVLLTLRSAARIKIVINIVILLIHLAYVSCVLLLTSRSLFPFLPRCAASVLLDPRIRVRFLLKLVKNNWEKMCWLDCIAFCWITKVYLFSKQGSKRCFVRSKNPQSNSSRIRTTRLDCTRALTRNLPDLCLVFAAIKKRLFSVCI